MAEDRPAKPSVYAEKFRIMLEVIPHPEGGGWSGTKMERATGGAVITSYFSSLRDGHIAVPRADKLDAIARAMGFPVGLWFESLSWWERVRDEGRGLLSEELAEERRRADKERLGGLLNRLFETRTDEETGEPYTNESVARKSGGALTPGDVKAMREGRIKDPAWTQVLALSDVFGVEASYWSGRGSPSTWRPPPAVLEATEGAESYLIFQDSLKLSGHDRGMLKVLAEHLRREQQGSPSGDERGRQG